MNPLYAVILAGDNEDRKIKQGKVIPNKAFVNINGRRMLEYVVDCYRSMPEFDGVAVVGPEKELAGIGDGIRIIPQKGNMIDNVVAAADELKSGWLLLSSCDIPLITPAAVRDFLAHCQGADLFYPLVSRTDCERVFPGVQRTWVKLKDGVFTGGNVILVKADKVATAAVPAGAFFDARKDTLKLAGLVGVLTLVKLMLKALSLAEIEMKMTKILGVPGKAVISSFPEIGTDVDKESDYNLVSAKLQVAR